VLDTTPDTRDDPGWVDALQAGDAEAFDRLVREHKDRVYYVVYRYLGNHHDAQEVAQDVFVRAYKSLQSFRGQARLTTWLHSIAANLAKNRLRDRNRRGRNRGASLDAIQENTPALAGALMQDRANPRAIAEAGELDGALQTCLDKLPDAYRYAFILRTFDRMPYDAMAETLAVPVGTIKSRMNQARRRLRDCLQERGVIG